MRFRYGAAVGLLAGAFLPSLANAARAQATAPAVESPQATEQRQRELAKAGRWAELEALCAETLRRSPYAYQAAHDRVRALVMLDRLPQAVLAMEAFPTSGNARPPVERIGWEVGGLPNWLLYLAAGEKGNALKTLPDDRLKAQPGLSVPGEADALRAWFAATPAERDELLDRSSQRPLDGVFETRPAVDFVPLFEYRLPTHLRLWVAVLRRYPGCYPAIYAHGAWLSRSGQREAAAEEFARAARLAPGWALPHRALAKYFALSSDTARMAAEFERASELVGYFSWNSNVPKPREPQTVKSRRNYLEGVALARKGKWKEAEALLANVVNYPYKEPARRMLLAVHLSQGHLEAAQELRGSLRTVPPLPGLAAGKSEPEPFPALPPRATAPKLRTEDEATLEMELALLRTSYPSPAWSVTSPFGSTDTFGTADLVELLLNDAHRRAPRDPRVRVWRGLWLLRSPRVWPEGTPEKDSTERAKAGRRTLESFLRDYPGYTPAVEALRR